MRITIEPTDDQSQLPSQRQHLTVTLSCEGDCILLDDAIEMFCAALTAWGYGGLNSSRVERLMGIPDDA